MSRLFRQLRIVMATRQPTGLCLLAVILSAFLLSACVQPRTNNASLPLSSINELPLDPLLRIETGMHTAAISSVDFDTRHRFLLTTSHDKTARVWDFTTGDLLTTLRVPSGHGRIGRLESGAISPDGNIIAVGGWTGKLHGPKKVYIFDRKSGKITNLLNGPAAVILHLSFSPSGKYLAATTGKGGGMYVWNTSNWSLHFQDTEYGEETHWVDFDKNGRLVTASYDGFVRLYDSNFKLITMRGIAGGREPDSVVFAPDGKLIAVGFYDSTKINILSGTNLSYLYTPDTGKIGKGSLGAVGWSANGQFLYGGGKRDLADKWQLLQWSGKGKKNRKKLLTKTSDRVVAVRPISRQKLIFATADPAIGVIKSTGNISWLKRSGSADFYGSPSGLRLNRDANHVELSFNPKKRKSISFSLTANGVSLQAERLHPLEVNGPNVRTEELMITQWEHQNYRHYTQPLRNGQSIRLEKFETSRSAAIRRNGQGFVLGTNWFVRSYDAEGNLRWRIPVQTAWAVNISGNGDVVVAALRDGTIRWYDWDDGRELMSLFLYNDGEDWVVWTPDGFFDHSPGGEKLIGFQMNKGWGQVPDFISIGQMYDSLYRPDIFIAGFLDDDKQYKSATRKVNLNKVIKSGMPPKVTIQLPSTNARKNSIRVKVQLTAGDSGLGQVVYRVNGITRLEENQQRNAENKKTLLFEKELPLEPGKNTIEVTAYNGNNTIESRPAVATVYRKISAKERKRRPSLYILAIGVNKYRDHALELRYPVEDARVFADTLSQCSRILFQDITVELILDNKVTQKNLGKVFQRLSAIMQPDDVFVLYTAGHGLSVAGNYYFLPWDLIYKNEQSVVKHGISREALQRFLAMIPANKAVILLDTCNAGAFTTVSSRGLNEKAAISKLTRATGRAIIMASTSTQEAYEGYKGHGVFTWTLIEALKGQADQQGDRDGIITVNELAEFVMEEVPKITMEKWQYEQFPLQDLTGRSFPVGLVQ